MSWIWNERTEPDGTKVYWCTCRWQGHEFQAWVSPCDKFQQPAWQWVCYSVDGTIGVHIEFDRVFDGKKWTTPESAAEAQDAAERILTGFGFVQEPQP